MVNLRRPVGVLVISVAFTLLIFLGSLASAQLPPGWASSDIGNPAIPGSADAVGSAITIQSAGYGISAGGDMTPDQFRFFYRVDSGDIDTVVRVTEFQSASRAASAGLMIRETLSSGSKHAYMSVSTTQGSAFQWRSRTDRKASNIDGPETQAPTWLRLVRQGDVFRGYSSGDGTQWTLVGAARISMTSDAYVGFAVGSADPAVTATATFESSEIGTPVPSLPPPWNSQDVGGPALPGESTGGDAFTVSGAGADIWDTSDQFQFMYQAASGNQEIVARLSALEASDPWAKAGLMIRAALDGPAAHASMFATEASGWVFQRRLFTGTSTFSTAGSPGSAPGWMRLVREGDLFSAYWSDDGVQWTLVGTDTIPMPNTVYIGLAVTGHDAEALATATFTNVDVHPVTATNKPPTITIESPVAGAAFLAPATIPITAVAADPDGSVLRVDFYNGPQLIGSSAASPFSIVWTGVPAGTYMLNAIATDNGGQTARSLPITTTVGVQALTRTVVFVPGADYVTSVTSWTVELRRSADLATAPPIATQTLGKPEVVLGEVTADISAIVDPLPPDSYYAVVISTGPGGSTASSPSPVFAK